MSGNTTNIHLAEERGQILGQDYDEEQLYGAVIRDKESAPVGDVVYSSKQKNANETRKPTLHHHLKLPRPLLPSSADRANRQHIRESYALSVAKNLERT